MVKNSIVPQIGMSVVHSLLHTSVIIREHRERERETFFEKKKQTKTKQKKKTLSMPSPPCLVGLR